MSGTLGGLDPVQSKVPVHHPSHVLEDVTTPEGVVQGELVAVGMDCRVGILAGAPVVEGDPRQLVGGSDIVGGVTRQGDMGALILTLGGNHDLTKPVVVEELGNDQVLFEGDLHPLQPLEIALLIHRQ
ncbi:MAG: hypothetical protein GEU79_08275 [Acidimicrobiia bacterium]|nr:hypothetical protein [Acidimicrobiia bacterium]